MDLILAPICMRVKLQPAELQPAERLRQDVGEEFLPDAPPS